MRVYSNQPFLVEIYIYLFWWHNEIYDQICKPSSVIDDYLSVAFCCQKAQATYHIS